LIKGEAMQIKFILEENKRKSTIGTTCNTNGNGKQAILIKEISEEEVDDINIIKKN
jgi:hypothetical protein